MRGMLRIGARSGAIQAPLSHWHQDVFRATWSDENFGSAFVTFRVGASGKVESVDVDGLEFKPVPVKP